jgi:hypothetical protein
MDVANTALFKASGYFAIPYKFIDRHLTRQSMATANRFAPQQ